MCFYVVVGRALVANLLRRLWTDLIDWLHRVHMRCHYWARTFIYRYDDVGPEDLSAPLHLCDQSHLVVEVEGKSWYCNIDRKTSQELVMSGGNGCFVVRRSTKYPLTLTLWYNNRPYNIPVRKRPDNKIALGSSKQNEKTFESVEEMINYYKKEELILFSGGEKTGTTILKQTLTKDQIEKGISKQLGHVLVQIAQ